MIYPKIKAVGRFLAKTALGTCALSVLLGLAYLVGMLSLFVMSLVMNLPESCATMSNPANVLMGLMMGACVVIIVTGFVSAISELGTKIYDVITGEETW